MMSEEGLLAIAAQSAGPVEGDAPASSPAPAAALVLPPAIPATRRHLSLRQPRPPRT